MLAGYILKKVALCTFKEIVSKYIYDSTFMFFNLLSFYQKGFSEALMLVIIVMYCNIEAYSEPCLCIITIFKKTSS